MASLAYRPVWVPGTLPESQAPAMVRQWAEHEAEACAWRGGLDKRQEADEERRHQADSAELAGVVDQLFGMLESRLALGAMMLCEGWRVADRGGACQRPGLVLLCSHRSCKPTQVRASLHASLQRVSAL